MIIALLFLILVAILFPGALRFVFWAILVCFALSQLHTARAEPRNHQTIYLDKLDKGLDDWWNARRQTNYPDLQEARRTR